MERSKGIFMRSRCIGGRQVQDPALSSRQPRAIWFLPWTQIPGVRSGARCARSFRGRFGAAVWQH